MDKMKKILLLIGICLFGISAVKSYAEPAKIPTCLDDIKGSRIAVITGSVQDLTLTAKGFGDNLLRLGSATDIFVSTTSGNADFAYVDSTCVIGGSLDRQGLVCLFLAEPSSGYGFGFKKDNLQLSEKFNIHLAKIRADGTLDAIIKHYTSGEFLNSPMTRYDFAADAKPFNISVCNFFPFEYIRDGEWTGLDLEIIYTFCVANGLRPVITNTEFTSLIPELNSGKADIVAAAMSISEERKQRIQFSDPYYYCSTACFAPRSKYFKDEAAPSKGFFQGIKDSFKSNFLEEDRYKLILDGLWESIVISIFAILFGAILGGFLCAMMMSRSKFVKNATNSICDLIGGIPILVLLMVMYYIVFVSTPLSGRVVAIIAFAINFGCAISSVYYQGISSVDRGQTEAGLALGFTPFRTFIYFVLPQASKKILPLFKGEGVSLIKNTSIVGYIAIQDLTKMCDIIRSRTFDAFFPLIAISIIYLILAWAFGKLIDQIGKTVLK